MKKTVFKFLLIAIIMVMGIVLGIMQVKPPSADEASPVYQRMMANIEKWAAEPHPADTTEIEKVRSLLLAELEDMGLSPTVETELLTYDDFVDAAAWRDNTTREDWQATHYDLEIPRLEDDGEFLLQNIIVKLDAPDTDRGVMFVSHYDSTYGGPGAADDMTSVCAMIEAARKLSQEINAGAVLQNDVYFLFTDGEEDGLLGAWRFVPRHPELKDKIDMVINLEARSNSGGLILLSVSWG